MFVSTSTRAIQLLSTVLVAVASLFLAGNAYSTAFTGWDFEDGTLQGWTLASTSTIGPTGYDALSRTLTPAANGLAAWDPVGYNSKDPKYGFAAAPTPFADRALPQDAPVVLRSPTFELHAGGQIIVHALGGVPGSAAIPPSNFNVLSGPSINRLVAGGDASYQGIALRRDSDGEYLLHKVRTANGSGANSWQQLTFTEAELDVVRLANPDALFTLDLIDTAHGTAPDGSFGNLNIDTISIPMPVETSLIQGGGMWSIRERLASTALITTLAAADTLLALPADNPGILADVDYTSPTINFHDGFAQNGHFANDPLFAGQNHFAMSVTGNINVLQGGPITFGFYANAGGRLLINGNLVAQDNYGDLATDTLGTINLSAGVHAVEFVYFEDTGFETVELYVATELGEFTSINEATFELLLATDLPLPEGIPGDYNDDGIVNAADYTVWRDRLGDTSLTNEGDGISPGTVDEDDYDFWVSQFGTGSGSGSGTSASVPEPSTLGLLLVIALVTLIRRRLQV